MRYFFIIGLNSLLFQACFTETATFSGSSFMKKAEKTGQEESASNKSLLFSCDQVSIENINEGVYKVDLDGNFLYFNNAFCKVLGYPEAEVRLQNFPSFMTPADSKMAFETFNRIYRTGQKSG